MKEIFIQVRGDKISVQADGASLKIQEIKNLLEKTLQALEAMPDQMFRNEIILKP
jgi:hypothetical protein